MPKRPTVLVVSADSMPCDYLQNRPDKSTFTVADRHCRDSRDFDSIIAYFQELKNSGNLGAVVITAFFGMMDRPTGLELMSCINRVNAIDCVPMIALSSDNDVLRDALNYGCTHTHLYDLMRDPVGLENIIHEALGIISKKS